MNNPSILIVTGIIALYTILGPFVLLAIYALFDNLSLKEKQTGKNPEREKDPAFWNREDVNNYLSQF